MPLSNSDILTTILASIAAVAAVWLSILKYMGFDKKLDQATKENKEHREAVDKTMNSQNTKIKSIEKEVATIKTEITEGFHGHREYLERNYMLASDVNKNFSRMEETLLKAVKSNTKQLDKIELIILEKGKQEISDLKAEIRDLKK